MKPLQWSEVRVESHQTRTVATYLLLLIIKHTLITALVYECLLDDIKDIRPEKPALEIPVVLLWELCF